MHLLRRTRGRRNADSPRLLYHLTNRARFKPDSRFCPTDNSVSIFDRG